MDIPSREIILSGYRHRYIDVGSGNKSLVLVHGVSSSLDIYEKVIPKFAEHYRVLAFDLLGFGESEKPPKENYTIHFYAKLINEFIQKSGALGEGKEVYLLGHSMGGKYAVATTILYPESVQKLILSNTDGFLHVPHVIRAASFWGVRHLVKKIVTRRAFVKKAMETVYYDASHITEEHFEYNVRMVQDEATFNTVMILNRNYKELDLARTGLRRRINEIKIPTLIIWGEFDKFISPKCAFTAKQEIANSELHIIKACGHAPMVEKHEEFAAVTLVFLEKP
ncbi:alpha/beta hydrolase fold [Chloroherpeton thalassium ATCC 35110]|uniref:Alpha/beta hydrolase fold n=1 Tax=Chloroherpeton thalassium (strain ATCC 35110 / GB-78) TaxID=517418 RepID=B3QSN3_CHLT3|nr:alpha/beta hydrolase [Chloroherpeton thalassium]ACF14080.1 alpha/beta hydrolase fold [Chloroherpeton thalassium ATCC 35110]